MNTFESDSAKRIKNSENARERLKRKRPYVPSLIALEPLLNFTMVRWING